MYKVLFIDDKPLIVEGLKHLTIWDELGLEIAGQCYDGSEALEFLSHHSADIVITDIRMPEMNGLDLIRKLKSTKPNMKYIVLSGYDDFQYVKEAVVLGIENYLLKPVSETELFSTLYATINKLDNETHRQVEYVESMDILRVNILNRWITGDIEQEEFDERSSLFGLQLTYSDVMAVVIKTQHEVEKKHEVRHSKKQLDQYIDSIISNKIDNVFIKQLCFYDYAGNIVILFFLQGNGPNTTVIKHVLENCIQNIKEEYGIEVFATVGSHATQFQDLHLSYTNAMALQEYQLLLPANSLIFYDDINNPDKGEDNVKFFIDVQELHRLIANYDQKAVIPFINGIYEQIHAPNVLKTSVVHEATLEILFNVKLIIKKLAPDSEFFSDEFKDIFLHVLALHSIVKIKECVCDIIKRTINFLVRKSDESNPLVKRALDYISINYANSINLKTLAAEFNIHPFYLGNLFKKETGFIFTDYLNSVRIENAKKQLVNPKANVDDVALNVGYSNKNYFYTIFKKLEGISPAEYKKGSRS